MHATSFFYIMYYIIYIFSFTRNTFHTKNKHSKIIYDKMHLKVVWLSLPFRVVIDDVAVVVNDFVAVVNYFVVVDDYFVLLLIMIVSLLLLLRHRMVFYVYFMNIFV